jgi:hypothetical protein
MPHKVRKWFLDLCNKDYSDTSGVIAQGSHFFLDVTCYCVIFEASFLQKFASEWRQRKLHNPLTILSDAKEDVGNI